MLTRMAEEATEFLSGGDILARARLSFSKIQAGAPPRCPSPQRRMVSHSSVTFRRDGRPLSSARAPQAGPPAGRCCDGHGTPAACSPFGFDSDSDDDGAAAGLVQLRQQAGCEPGRASQDAAAAQAALAAGGPTTRTLGGMPFSWKLHTGKHALLWLRPYHLSAA